MTVKVDTFRHDSFALPTQGDEDQVNVEKVLPDLIKKILRLVAEYSNNRAILSELTRQEQMVLVRELAGLYSTKGNWNVTVIPALQVLCGGAQIFASMSPERLKQFEEIGKMLDVGKRFFDTLDQGKRTELEAKNSLAKLFHEGNEREKQTYEQQVAELVRKLEEAQRRQADAESVIAK